MAQLHWIDIGDDGAPMWICIDDDTYAAYRAATDTIINTQTEREPS